jgi:hypothetical protein
MKVALNFWNGKFVFEDLGKFSCFSTLFWIFKKTLKTKKTNQENMHQETS